VATLEFGDKDDEIKRILCEYLLFKSHFYARTGELSNKFQRTSYERLRLYCWGG